MPGDFFIRANGVWKAVVDNEFYVRANGAYRKASEAYVYVDGGYKQFWPRAVTPPPVQCPAPGTYTLAASSLYLPAAATGYAEFDTSGFQFGSCIKQISIQISWAPEFGLDNNRLQVSGRPNGNFYREIQNNGNEWDGRTISHRIDTFDATSLTDFNSGAAIGFTMTETGPPGKISPSISNVRLVLTT